MFRSFSSISGLSLGRPCSLVLCSRTEVLKFLRDSYADGLTIQIWNYYNTYALEKGRAELKKILDRSTITFKTKPESYVNAIVEGNPLDCVVTAEP